MAAYRDCSVPARREEHGSRMLDCTAQFRLPSQWLCPLAAWEGQERNLVLAAKSGCACSASTLYAAASRGSLGVLEAAHRQAIIQGRHCRLQDGAQMRKLHKCLEAAAGKGGGVDCLMALLRCKDLRLSSGLGSLLSCGLDYQLDQSKERYSSSSFFLLCSFTYIFLIVKNDF